MRRLLLGAAAVAVVAAAACTDNGANSLAPIGAPVYGVAHALAGANVPQGTAAFVFRHTASAGGSGRDSVTAYFQGFDVLEGGAYYALWLGDSSTGTFKRATGALRTFRTDTTLNAQGEPVITNDSTLVGAAVNQFQGIGPRNRFRFSTSRTQSGLAASDSIATFLITIETTAGATTPNPRRRIFWARRATDVISTVARLTVPIAGGRAFGVGDTATYDSTRARFGNFDPSILNQYVYVLNGRGRVYVQNSVMEVNDSSLPRPPLGYFYGVYGVKRDSLNQATDTVYFGPLHSPYPRRTISLREADSVTVDAEVQPVTPQSILAGSVRVNADTVARLASATGNKYRGIAQIILSLESKHKADTRLGPSHVLRSDLPGVVRFTP